MKSDFCFALTDGAVTQITVLIALLFIVAAICYIVPIAYRAKPNEKKDEAKGNRIYPNNDSHR